jgi:hypothetical protein
MEKPEGLGETPENFLIPRPSGIAQDAAYIIVKELEKDSTPEHRLELIRELVKLGLRKPTRRRPGSQKPRKKKVAVVSEPSGGTNWNKKIGGE